jgi:hypothetical protein
MLHSTSNAAPGGVDAIGAAVPGLKSLGWVLRLL